MKVFSAAIIGASVAHNRYYDYDRHFDANYNFGRQVTPREFRKSNFNDEIFKWQTDRFPSDSRFSYGWMNKNHYGNGYSNAWDYDNYRMFSRNDRPFYGPMNKSFYSPSYYDFDQYRFNEFNDFDRSYENDRYSNNRAFYGPMNKSFYSPSYFNKYTNDYRFSRNPNYYFFDQYRFNEFNDFDRSYENNRYSNNRAFYGPMNRNFYSPSLYNSNQYRFNDFSRYSDHHSFNNFDFGNMNRWMHEFDSFHHSPQMSRLYQVAERHFWMNSGRSDNSEHLMSSVNQTESNEDSNPNPSPQPKQKTKSKSSSNPQTDQNANPNPNPDPDTERPSLFSLVRFNTQIC